MKKEKVIVIGGGVGPMAGVRLHQLIIENTNTNGTDQDHLSVCHLSYSSLIEDRTKYLLNKTKFNPASQMFKIIKSAYKTNLLLNKNIVVGIPCNTFHAPKIFNQFLKLLKANNINVKVVNMITTTVKYIQKTLPKTKKIGILASTGTRTSGIYQQALSLAGFKIVEVPKKFQPQLHNSIYHKKWGIKAKYPVTNKAKANLSKYCKMLHQQRVEAIILGCTEIPLALKDKKFRNIPLIDPMFCLALKLIKYSNKNKLDKKFQAL